jgi:transposase
MNKAVAPLVMSIGQREALTVLSRSSSATHRQVQRAKVLLMAADGVASLQIAATVGVIPVTVRSWRSRFAQEGLAKFSVVRGGRGRKPRITPERVEKIVRLTQHEKPDGATHWSCRSMAKQVGVRAATVQRIWSGVASSRTWSRRSSSPATQPLRRSSLTLSGCI